MKPADNNMEKIIKRLHFAAGDEMRQRILADVLKAHEQSQCKKTAELKPGIWRIIMKSSITKLAAAAVIIIVAALVITFLDKSVAPAYAIEQTIQASHSVRYLHIKDFDAEHEDQPKESWLQCDEYGQVQNVRMDFPDWASGGDGHKIVVWNQGKAHVWFEKKKGFLTISDKTVADKFLGLALAYDPKLAVERLCDLQTHGKVKVQIDEPSDKSKPISLTATYLPESGRAERQEVWFVDQATKLVTAIEFYQLKDGQYRNVSTMEFYDYNQPIEAKLFCLDNEVPADVLKIDQTTQEIGLEQGNLSNVEIAAEVVRQFFEALIAKDYAKAGKLFSGMPAEKMQEIFGKMNFVRIVSIGQPVGHSQTRSLQVPCTIEIEKDGVIHQLQPKGPFVRQVESQPTRWQIIGGI